MNENELMVTIPVNRYEELLDTETRVSILAEITKKESHFVTKDEIAMILNFTLPAEEKKKGPF